MTHRSESGPPRNDEERREGNRKGRYRSGRGHRHPEAVGEERRQPVLGGPSGQRRRSEVKEHNPEGDVREQQPKAAPHREVRLGACGLGLRLPGPAVLMQEEDQHDGIGDADDAEPVEGLLPGKHRGDRSPESAHGLSDIESGHVDADGETPGLARVVVGDQRKAGRNVERLADAHQGPQPVDLPERGRIAHQQRHGRPDAERSDDEPLAADPVGDGPGNGTHQSVDPEEDGHQPAEIDGLLQFGDIDLHRLAHRREHLPVHVVQQRHDPQQRHDDPGIVFLQFCVFHDSRIRLSVQRSIRHTCGVRIPGRVSPPSITAPPPTAASAAPARAARPETPALLHVAETGSKSQSAERKR